MSSVSKVILAEPSKDTPLIVRAVASVVAVPALPETLPVTLPVKLPETFPVIVELAFTVVKLPAAGVLPPITVLFTVPPEIVKSSAT